MSRVEDALAAYEQAADLSADTEDQDLCFERVGALYAKAQLLIETGRDGEAAATLAEMVNEFYEDPPPSRLGMIIDAELLFAHRALALGQPDAALAGYDQLVARYGGRPELDAHDAVVRARLSKASILAGRGDLETAGSIYREVLAEAAAEPTGALKVAHAVALNGCAYVARALGEGGEAASLYRAVIDRFEPGGNHLVDKQIRLAREASKLDDEA